MTTETGFRAIFEQAIDPMLVADDAAQYLDANRAACQLFGLTREQLCARRVVDFAPAEAKESFETVWQAFLEAGSQRGEWTLQLEDGRSFPIEFSATANIVPGRHLSIFRDISERKRYEAEREELLAQIQELALTDPLTQLPNRRAWNERLRQELARATRTGETVMIAVIDLDDFKRLNDTRGHAAGDELLREIAERWQHQLRDGDLLARVGGDEFCLLFPSGSDPGDDIVLRRLQAAMPDGQLFSFGVAIWDGTEDALKLFERADHALYQDKRRSEPAQTEASGT